MPWLTSITGFCNDSSVLAAPPDYPVCGFYGEDCPEEAYKPTITLVALIGIVVGVMVVGTTVIGYAIRKRSRMAARKEEPSTFKKPKTSTSIGDR